MFCFLHGGGGQVDSLPLVLFSRGGKSNVDIRLNVRKVFPEGYTN